MPEIGRFLQKDPKEGMGGSYVFALRVPLATVDPIGRDVKDWPWDTIVNVTIHVGLIVVYLVYGIKKFAIGVAVELAMILFFYIYYRAITSSVLKPIVDAGLLRSIEGVITTQKPSVANENARNNRGQAPIIS